MVEKLVTKYEIETNCTCGTVIISITNPIMEFAERVHPLRKWRKIKGLTLENCASSVGTTRHVWHAWETGKRHPNPTFLPRIREFTDGEVRADDFFPDLESNLPASSASLTAGRYPAGAAAFPHRDLTGLAGLAPWELLFLLDEAEQWVDLNRQSQKRDDRLAGLTIINAFFENSTRTLLSFEIAGKRLGADVVNMHAAQSSVKKGETLIDTAMTLNAMHADAMVIRHGSSGAVQLIADKVDCPVLNAGDGQHEHPTQGLLDALTIRKAKG
ncbi:MAG: hypothetical protein ABL881_11635, partial [Novosphingobium sp.]